VGISLEKGFEYRDYEEEQRVAEKVAEKRKRGLKRINETANEFTDALADALKMAKAMYETIRAVEEVRENLAHEHGVPEDDEPEYRVYIQQEKDIEATKEAIQKRMTEFNMKTAEYARLVYGRDDARRYTPTAEQREENRLLSQQ